MNSDYDDWFEEKYDLTEKINVNILILFYIILFTTVIGTAYLLKSIG